MNKFIDLIDTPVKLGYLILYFQFLRLFRDEINWIILLLQVYKIHFQL